MNSEERLKVSLLSFICSHDIDESVCKKVKNPICLSDLDYDRFDCMDCICEFFKLPCKWLADNDVCVNDKSEYCADFVGEDICGGCSLREPVEQKEK